MGQEIGRIGSGRNRRRGTYKYVGGSWVDMQRATIIISSDVQDVGFRATVMRLGQKAGITGYVENQPNGTVRMICEGDRKVLDSFIKIIDIHEDGVEVENIDVKWSEATGEFEWFTVKFGDLGSEMFQGFATAKRWLVSVGEKVDVVGQKVDKVGEKVGQNIEETRKVGEKVGQNIEETRKVGEKVEQNIGETRKVHEETRAFREETVECFDRLDDKYHIISDVLVSMNSNMDRWQKESQATREQLTQSTTALTRLAGSIERLIEDHINKEEP